MKPPRALGSTIMNSEMTVSQFTRVGLSWAEAAAGVCLRMPYAREAIVVEREEVAEIGNSLVAWGDMAGKKAAKGFSWVGAKSHSTVLYSMLPS
jgi:hypothetical protein